MIKQKKKKKSLSAIINDLRERLKKENDAYWRLVGIKRNLVEEIELFKKLFPTHYYRIKFKAESKENTICEFTRIIEAQSPELAIYKKKNELDKPELFELLDIQKLA